MKERSDKARQTDHEINAGRKMVRHGMANGLIDQILLEKGWKDRGITVILNSDAADPREWYVTIQGNSGVTMEENWWAFPSDETITKMMLVGIL